MVLVCGLIAGGYLIGSISFSSLISRRFASADILSFGSRNAGASNVGQLLGFKAMLIVGCLDLSKSALYVAGLSYFDFSTDFLILFGCSVIAGHCWSCFLGFKGGRGIASLTGVILGLAWFSVLSGSLLIASVGLVLGYRPVFVAIALIGLPFIGFLLGHDPVGLVCLVSMIFVKRVTGNDLMPQFPDGLLRGYLRRVIFDRDIESNTDWVRRVNR